MPLLDRITKGEIDPSFVITHRIKLDEGPETHKMFSDKKDECRAHGPPKLAFSGRAKVPI
jgi:threonine dehydrogenase-like Zn-dependent dehydrogenase